MSHERDIMDIEDINYDELNPNIREVVRYLRSCDFETCDSGDGSNFQNGMEGAYEYPMVAISVAPVELISKALTLVKVLYDVGIDILPIGAEESLTPCIQATFDPADGCAIITLMNVTDNMLVG